MTNIRKFHAKEQLRWRIRPAEIAVVGIALIVGLGYGAYSLIPPDKIGQDISQEFDICSGSIRVTCVVDGDTFWLDGTKVRVADIDAPEIGTPKCAAEKALGERSKMRLREILNAGAFDLAPSGGRDEDKYGRKLRVILRAGQSLGNQLVIEGLARTWTGKREPWC